MTRLRSIWVLTAILLLHFWIGLNYSLTIPAWEAYDEPGHLAYALTLAKQGRLPTDSDVPLNWERIQPPLYYLGLAAFLRVSGSDTTSFHYPPQDPYFAWGQSRNYAVRNATPADVAATLHLARLYSLLLSLIGIPFVYLAARRFIGEQGAFAATLIFALWPQYLFASATVSNDGTAAVIGAVIIWLLIRRWRLATVLTILVGAAIKLNVVLLIVPILLSRWGIRRLLPFIAVALVAVIGLHQLFPAIWLPISLHNAQGDPLITGIEHHLFSTDGLNLIGAALSFAYRSSFGLFGWGNVPYQIELQNCWGIGLALATIGLIWAHRRFTRVTLSLILILVALIIGALALVLFYQDVTLLPGRYLLPGLSALCILLVIGWRRLNTRIAPLACIGLIMLGVWTPFGFFVPSYKYPVEVLESDIPNRQKVELAPGVMLMGYRLGELGSTLPVELYLKATAPILESYQIHLELIGDDGQTYGRVVALPTYPTTDWQVGVTFRDLYVLPLAASLPDSVIGHIKLYFSQQVTTVFGTLQSR